MRLTRIGITLPEKLLELIEKRRGDTARSRFVVRMLERAMGVPEKEATKYE